MQKFYPGIPTAADLCRTSCKIYLPDAVYYTGHCTGDKALEILTRELREIHPLMTGTVIEA